LKKKKTLNHPLMDEFLKEAYFKFRGNWFDGSFFLLDKSYEPSVNTPV